MIIRNGEDAKNNPIPMYAGAITIVCILALVAIRTGLIKK